MRRTGFVIAACALASMSGAGFAAPPEVPATTGAKPTTAAKPNPARRAARVARAGTTTAGANGFLPLPFGAIAALSSWAAATTVLVAETATSASPD